jgi:predicted metal-binding protein
LISAYANTYLRGTDKFNMSNQHTLFVCTTCASIWQDGRRVGKSGGQLMLEQLSQLHLEWPLSDRFPIRPVECMSACSRPCVVAFAAQDKHTYLFGDLSLDPETFDATAQAILDCAYKYYCTEDGSLPWAERPQPLKKGILARIPPVPQLAVRLN